MLEAVGSEQLLVQKTDGNAQAFIVTVLMLSEENSEGAVSM